MAANGFDLKIGLAITAPTLARAFKLFEKKGKERAAQGMNISFAPYGKQGLGETYISCCRCFGFNVLPFPSPIIVNPALDTTGA